MYSNAEQLLLMAALRAKQNYRGSVKRSCASQLFVRQSSPNFEEMWETLRSLKLLSFVYSEDNRT